MLPHFLYRADVCKMQTPAFFISKINFKERNTDMYNEIVYRQSECGGDCRRCDYKNQKMDAVFTIYDEVMLGCAIDSTEGTDFSIEPIVKNMEEYFEDENDEFLKKEIQRLYSEVECPLPDHFCSVLRCTAYLYSFAEKLLGFLHEKQKEPVDLNRLFS